MSQTKQEKKKEKKDYPSAKMKLHLGKFLHTETGRYLMSALLGFGLASLFRKMCTTKDCLRFRAPPLEAVKNKIYRTEDPEKCVTYEPVATKCSLHSKTIEME